MAAKRVVLAKESRARSVSPRFSSEADGFAKALQKYAPGRCGKFRCAKSFGVLEKLGKVPESLRALWLQVDGAEEIIVVRPDDEAMDLLSVARAARETSMLRRVAHLPRDLVAFATDGAGNFLVMDARGRVLDWDHETRETKMIAPSLARLLARTIAAIKRNELFGGPEAPKGTPHASNGTPAFAVPGAWAPFDPLLGSPVGRVGGFSQLYDGEIYDQRRTALEQWLSATPAGVCYFLHVQNGRGKPWWDVWQRVDTNEWVHAFSGSSLDGAVRDLPANFKERKTAGFRVRDTEVASALLNAVAKGEETMPKGDPKYGAFASVS